MCGIPHNGDVTVNYRILETQEFRNWFQDQNLKTQLIVTARLERLQSEGHWGFVNRFDRLTELKWTSGLRVYSALIENTLVIVLLGGNKNGQNKDIKKAKSLLEKSLKRV
jgi:putative addiction module killer protein